MHSSIVVTYVMMQDQLKLGVYILAVTILQNQEGM